MRAPRLVATAAAAAVLLLAPLAACSDDAKEDGANAAADAEETAEAEPTTTTSPGAAASEAEAYEGEVDGFYEVPDPLPEGPHGTLIRSQVMEDYEFTGATTYRIMYLSESVAGEPIAVTGMASVPTADAPEDGRPMIAIAHGTTGIADECSPSVTGGNAEMGLVESELSEDFLIAATDYEGLGTPGRHPYLVGESEGRSTIDGIIAAGQLPDADPGTKLGIVGYSQGGHGALWANQVASEWAPDLEVVGTFSGAPASEVGVIISAAPQVKGFGIMVIAGIAAAYPDVDVSQMLTPAGQEVLDSVDEGCVGDTFDAAGSAEEELFVADGGQTPEWSKLGAAQDAGTEKTNDAPVLLIHSNEDATVPTFFIDQVEKRMCANGQVVERIDLDEGGHTQAAIPAYAEAMDWLQGLFAGTEDATDTCPAT
ncbi:lipase family protein [Aquihabitans daechungensis]|uniref:lipase family protein n=1 Tax=Aquihabitans daechungensis TaxID=1052257 RepID=UPI003BA0F031